MRSEKQLLLDSVKENIKSSTAVLITSYKKMAPDVAWEFRTNLAKSGGHLEVIKKRILVKAASEASLELQLDELDGHIGVIYSQEDGLDTTKTVFDFIKEYEGNLKVLCGKFEETLYSAEDVKALSKLPSKDEMRAQFLGLLEAPMSQTLSVMESILTCIPYCLENKSKQST